MGIEKICEKKAESSGGGRLAGWGGGGGRLLVVRWSSRTLLHLQHAQTEAFNEAGAPTSTRCY